MGILTPIYKRIAQEIARQQQAVMRNLPMGYHANYKGTDDLSLINEGYLKNADIYSLVQMDVRKFASIPINTYKVKANEFDKSWHKYRRYKRYMGAKTIEMQRKALEEIVEDNEVSKLLQRPNPWQGSDQFFQSARGFRILTGETFIWKYRENGVGKPVALYVLPTQHMSVVGSRESMFAVDHYVFTVDGVDIKIERQDIIHWKSWTPEFDLFNREQLRGLSPLRALMRSITASNEANDAMVSMYQNGGAKYLIYDKTMDELSPEQSAQLDGVINRKLNNNKMKAAVARVQGDWGGINLGLSSVDMQLLDSMKVTRKQFSDAFGIPIDLVEGDKTYANRQQAMKDWVSNTLYPDIKSLCDEFNRALVPEFGISSSRIVVDTDISMLPEMQEDMEKLTNIANVSWWVDGFNKQVMTGNEPDPRLKGVYFIPSSLQTLDNAMTDISAPLSDDQVRDAEDIYNQDKP